MSNWTKEREAEIRRRCEAATKGPWTVGGGDELLDSDGQNLLYDDAFCCITRTDDAVFAAHARTDLPDALERITELEAENQKLRSIAERMEQSLQKARLTLYPTLFGGGPLADQTVRELWREVVKAIPDPVETCGDCSSIAPKKSASGTNKGN